MSGQRNAVAMSLEKNYNSAKPAASMFNQNGNTQSPLFGTLSRGFNVSHYLYQFNLENGKITQLYFWIIWIIKSLITPPSGARGGLKENGQNPDSGSKNSENQNNDAIL